MEISEISAGIKGLAREPHTRIIVAAQLTGLCQGGTCLAKTCAEFLGAVHGRQKPVQGS